MTAVADARAKVREAEERIAAMVDAELKALADLGMTVTLGLTTKGTYTDGPGTREQYRVRIGAYL